MTLVKAESVWKALGFIFGIAAVGWAAAMYVSSLQTKDDARSDHERIMDRVDTSSSGLGTQLSDLNKEVDHNRYINARIEISQRQINDQLQLITDMKKPPRQRDQGRIEELSDRIQRRGKALEQSYEQTPVIPRVGSGGGGKPVIDPNDPLTGLGDL